MYIAGPQRMQTRAVLGCSHGPCLPTSRWVPVEQGSSALLLPGLLACASLTALSADSPLSPSGQRLECGGGLGGPPSLALWEGVAGPRGRADGLQGCSLPPGAQDTAAPEQLLPSITAAPCVPTALLPPSHRRGSTGAKGRAGPAAPGWPPSIYSSLGFVHMPVLTTEPL